MYSVLHIYIRRNSLDVYWCKLFTIITLLLVFVTVTIIPIEVKVFNSHWGFLVNFSVRFIRYVQMTAFTEWDHFLRSCHKSSHHIWLLLCADDLAGWIGVANRRASLSRRRHSLPLFGKHVGRCKRSIPSVWAYIRNQTVYYELIGSGLGNFSSSDF